MTRALVILTSPIALIFFIIAGFIICAWAICVLMIEAVKHFAKEYL